MRSSIVRWAAVPVVVLALSFPAIAQRGGRGGAQGAPAAQAAPAAQGAQSGKLPGKDSLYQGNRLRPDPTPGGPAPVRDVSGSWAGNLTPQRGEIPPLTPVGMQMKSLLKSEVDFGTGGSNDPMNTCDPLGTPRNLVFETRGLAFGAIGPDRIAILHQYQRIWRYAWVDGKHPLPTKFDVEGGVPSRYYGYSVGRWENDHTLVIDTVGLSEATWLDKAGNPHSVDAHIEERYERIDHNHINFTATVTDPKVFTKPFVISKNEYRWIPDQEAEEQLCVPSEMINYMKVISDPGFGVGDKK